MTAIAAAASRRIGRIPLAVPAAIAFAWVLAIAAEATGHAHQLHHDALIEGGPPFALALALFLVAWQVMVAAMMLPSSLPLARMFATASATQPKPRAAMAGFIGGYALVWSAFGAAAFCGDLGLHRTVDSWPWLHAHEYLISGGALLGAGAFQFTRLKDVCLEKCRHPGAFMLRYYARGTRAAFNLGKEHGRFCLGCCWALMLLMFAAGVANLWWMAALTALMVYEKTGSGGRRAVPVAGIVLLAWAALVIAHPAWLPHALSGVES